jgi:hypothetical protein
MEKKESTSEKIRQAIASGNIVEALRMGTFFKRTGLNAALVKAVETAFDAHTKPKLLAQFKIDIEIAKEKGLIALKTLVNYPTP